MTRRLGRELPFSYVDRPEFLGGGHFNDLQDRTNFERVSALYT